MYQNVFIERGSNSSDTMKVWLWDDESPTVIETEYQNYAYIKSSTGDFTTLYGDRVEKTKYFRYDDSGMFETDVNTSTRFLIDCYYESDDVSKNHRIIFFDIETDCTDGFPNMDTADKAITSIAYSVNGREIVLILDKNGSINNDSNSHGIFSFCTERDLLISFLQRWSDINPTIVSGWNSDNFDIPYLIKRISVVLGKSAANKLSPIGVIKRNNKSGRYTIAGISCLDYMILYRKFTQNQEENYRLDTIGRKVVGMGKIEYETTLQALYDTDINKFIEYNLNDVRILVALENKLKYIELAQSVCHKCHVPYEDIYFSSKYIEGAILTYMRRKKLVACNKPQLEADYDYDHSDKFEGAFVKEPVPGLYKWVFDLDLESLYPGTIRSLNISPETKIGKLLNWNSDAYIKGELKEIYLEGTEHGMYINDFIEFMATNRYSLSSNGVLYSTDKRGIICEILDNWFNERVEYRKLEKKYGLEKNQESFEFYNNRQKTVKVLLNSIYGCLGLPSWRFYDVDNAVAVTSTGQTVIKTSVKLVNQVFNNRLNTKDADYNIYIDTDSCFFSVTPLVKSMDQLSDDVYMKDYTYKIATEMQDYLNKMYDVLAKKMFFINSHKFKIKQEYISKSGLWIAKKRYAQWVINSGGIDCDELDVKGLDVVRSSFPGAFKIVMEQILRDILKSCSKEHIDDIILSFKSSIDSLPIASLAKNTTVKFIGQRKNALGQFEDVPFDPVTRSPFNFIKGSPAQCKAGLAYNDFLKKYKIDKKTPLIHNNSKIKWVYLLNNPLGIECIAFKDDGTDPNVVLDFIKMYIDRERIFDSELLNKITDFYNALKWPMFSPIETKSATFFSF